MLHAMRPPACLPACLPVGYQLMWQFPRLMNRTISFDIGSGGHPNVTYQGQNALAFDTRDSAPSMTSARYWDAPCLACAVWRSAWPYASNVSFRGLLPRPRPPVTKPLLFIWGNNSRGRVCLRASPPERAQRYIRS